MAWSSCLSEAELRVFERGTFDGASSRQSCGCVNVAWFVVASSRQSCMRLKVAGFSGLFEAERGLVVGPLRGRVASV